MSSSQMGREREKSSTSQDSKDRFLHSRSMSQFISVSDLEELSDNDLVKQVNKLKRDIKILNLENEIIEKTILRIEPGLMHGVQQAYEYAIKLKSSTSLNVGSFVAKSATSRYGMAAESMTSRSRLIGSPSRLSTRRGVESTAKTGILFGTGPRVNVLERSELVATETEIMIRRVNVLERSELVATETEIMIRRLEASRAKTARQHALLNAKLEEIGLRNDEVDKATEAFNQQVIIEGFDKIAKRIPAEIWIRFMNEWVGYCDKEIGKLRLRTSTANTQFTKLKNQICVKAELSENLCPVDFEKLKIENKVALETIDKKTKYLKLLKRMTGDANLNLAIHKLAMMEQNDYLSEVQDVIENTKEKTKKLGREEIKIAFQAEDLKNKLTELKKVTQAYEVPDTMDYVRIKSCWKTEFVYNK
ncbi:hypothetical protein NE865_09235 [Phthorimaea operculella]|nr:hypothetical protein NE865_09235 [Phthorimaea operculella]